MKRLSLLFCLLLASGVSHAASWTDLWLTNDQQAQRLLDEGKPADAAGKFEDARRRAYAEIKARQYATAAKRLESFEDPPSQYNRGNALARSGKLEDALAAYDQVIKQTPADSVLGRDARHNRDLVAKQLEQQQASQAQSGGQSGDQSGQQNDQNDRGEQGMPPQDGEQHANGSQQQQQNQGQNQQAAGSQGEQSQRRQAHAQQSQDSQSQSGSSHSGNAEQEAADARRDAEAALARAKQNVATKSDEQMNGQMAQPGEQPSDEEGKAAALDQPPSEQTLALDQWLRQIPDDPAGLLRRKFLIEHMKRQQESRQ